MEKNDRKAKKGEEREATAVPPFHADYVPAEQNLETIGYFAAGYKRKYPTAEQQSNVIVLNQERRVEIVPTAKYGYPNSDDLDFYRAFLKICQQQTIFAVRRTTGRPTFHPRLQLPIGFHTRELIRTSGRTESARERLAVHAWIERSTFTGIKGDLYSAKTRQFDTTFGGPLFSQFVFVGGKLRSGQMADRNYVWPSDWFLSNYYYHYIRRVDLAFHQRLHKAIAKTLYPILDTGWYATQGKPYMKRYTDLCALLFIPAHKKLSLAKQQLDPSHAELKRERFLGSWEYPLDRNGKWTGVVRWSPGEKWFQDQEDRMLRRGQVERDMNPPRSSAKPLFPAGVESPPQPILTSESRASGPSAHKSRDRYAELVKDFYQALGQPRISHAKLEKGRNLLATLTDGESRSFSLEELGAALAWIVSHKEDRFAGKVYSLNLLPEVIGEALQGAERAKKTQQEKRRQQEEAERLTAEHTRRQQLEVRYRSLAPTEQASLREQATDNLLQGGVSRRLLLETLIMGEICRLLEEHGKPREPE